MPSSDGNKDTNVNGALTREEQATTTASYTFEIRHAERKNDNGFQSAKDDIMEAKSITIDEGYTKLLIGDLQIIVKSTSEEKNTFNESIYEHSGVPYYMTSSRDTIKCDGENVHTVENESEKSMCDSLFSLNEFEQKPLALQHLKYRLLITEEKIVQVLTRADDSHKYIEDLIWKTQIEERQKGVASGVTSTQLRSIKEAFENMKSDYLKLLMDR